MKFLMLLAFVIALSIPAVGQEDPPWKLKRKYSANVRVESQVDREGYSHLAGLLCDVSHDPAWVTWLEESKALLEPDTAGDLLDRYGGKIDSTIIETTTIAAARLVELRTEYGQPTIEALLNEVAESVPPWSLRALGRPYRRTFESADGRTLDAEFVGLEGSIVLMKVGEQSFRVPMKSLSETDQVFVAEWAELCGVHPSVESHVLWPLINHLRFAEPGEIAWIEKERILLEPPSDNDFQRQFRQFLRDSGLSVHDQTKFHFKHQMEKTIAAMREVQEIYNEEVVGLFLDQFAEALPIDRRAIIIAD